MKWELDTKSCGFYCKYSKHPSQTKGIGIFKNL